jgi:hypothetical protein
MGHFSGYFEGASTFLTPKLSMRDGQFRGRKSVGPLKISLEMAHKVICPQQKIISRIFKISGTLLVGLEIQSVMLVFSTPLANHRPSNLLTGSAPYPPPFVNKYRTGLCI